MTKTKEFSIKKDMRSFQNFHKTKSDAFVSKFRVGDNEYRVVLSANLNKSFEIESYGGNVYDNFEEEGDKLGKAKMTVQDNGICITYVEIGDSNYQITSYPELKDGTVEYFSGPVVEVEYDEDTGEVTPL